MKVTLEEAKRFCHVLAQSGIEMTPTEVLESNELQEIKDSFKRPTDIQIGFIKETLRRRNKVMLNDVNDFLDTDYGFGDLEYLLGLVFVFH